MKQSYFLREKELFPGSGTVRKFAFKTVHPRDNYALLAAANHRLAMNFTVLRGKSAHFRIKDCFECLSP